MQRHDLYRQLLPRIFLDGWVPVNLALPFKSRQSILDQAETVSRRVEKFAELMQSVWVSRNDYERRVQVVRVSFQIKLIILIIIPAPAPASVRPV